MCYASTAVDSDLCEKNFIWFAYCYESAYGCNNQMVSPKFVLRKYSALLSGLFSIRRRIALLF